MVCPRCALKLPKNTLVCARCGEETPRQTNFVLDTRPPADGPRLAPLLNREMQLDRRGRGVRALGNPPPAAVRARPVAPHWSRGREAAVREPVRDLPVERRGAPRLVPQVAPPQPYTVGQVALLSSVHQAKTEPNWHKLPEDALPEPAVARTAEAQADEVLAAPASLRAAAWTIDAALMGVVFLAALLLGATAFGWARVMPHLDHGFDYVVDGLFIGRKLGLLSLGFVAICGYAYTVLAHALLGQTLGKRLVGVRLVTRHGEQPSLRECAWRAAATVLSVLLGGVGLAMALFDKRRRTLHDRLVGTEVIRVELAPEE